MPTIEEILYTELVDPIELTDVNDTDLCMFSFNDKCYFIDGSKYLVYDGNTIAEVTPYVPTLFISKPPAGGGTAYEDFNLLGSKFKDSFSSDGSATVYQMSLTGLDTSPITAMVNGVQKNEFTDFTVDRANGKITFNSVPATGTNNVIITASKTIAGLADRIKKCRFHTIFGGSNDTRVFLSGNPDMPDYVWRLGLQDPTYAPENGFYKFNDRVKGFSKQYDYLVVHRENGYHQVTFDLNDQGVASFPSKPLNDQVGTISTKSIQIIENNPVALSKNGVYMLTGSNVRDERNVQHISAPVDAKLLRETNLKDAVAYDFDRKYWLIVNGNAYIYDYSTKEWYLYDNINASHFIELNQDLLFGSANEGLLYRFKREDDGFAYNDDGQAINAYWKSKYITFGADEYRKLVEKVFYSLKPSSKTSVDVYYVTDKKTSEIIKTTRMDLFDFTQIDFSDFTFLTNTFPQENMVKVKAKKISVFQAILKNDKLDESLGILSLGVKYRYQSLIK
ncbi:hypothetical protein [Bacillus sp. 03113]|uniref:hypothetical protein n=1 Tax=Bacillus sp. 03113 TaxID=2578211 RepID=UPI0011441A16|nr:hypothetical protein [Bacillus sp. 03113]